MKFHENILNDFQAIERISNYYCRISKGITPKMYRQELMSLCSARHLTILYISMKFHENILNVFQVIERIQNYNYRISKR